MMVITIEDHNNQLQTQAIAAGYLSVEQYLRELAAQDVERLAIDEGVRAVAEGRGSPAEVVYRRIRQNLGTQA